MTRRTILSAVAFVLAAVLVWWVLFVAVPRWTRDGSTELANGAAAPAADSAAAQRKITATLYYISEDGMSLQPAQREVPFGEATADQARAIIEAQIASVEAPLASAIPPGTTLRAIYVSERGEAFVDLSGEVTANHPGGALEELFTVFTIVNALTVNLPAVTRVQILIDGKEVDTLAGHVDLRHPLARNITWVKSDNPS